MTGDDAMTCATCGAATDATATTCPACGAGRAPAAEERKPVTPADIVLALVRGNWVGAALVAVSTAFTAGSLGLLLALLAKPVDFGLSNTLALATVIATGAFGADLKLSVSGGEDAFFDISGDAALGVFPFTVTLVALVVAVLVFRRVTRDYPSALVAVGDAARAALLFGVCLAVPALVFSADNDELGRGWGQALSQQALDYDLDMGADALSAFGLGFLILLAVLGATAFARGSRHRAAWGEPAPGATGWVGMLRALVPPVLGGLATIVALLPVAGGIGFLSLVPGEDTGGEVTGEGARTAASFIVGGLANGGMWLISLGSGAPVGGVAETTGEPTEQEYSRLWGEVTDSEPGLWIAPLVLLGVLALATYVVLRLARREHGLLALGAWLVALLVAVPLLVRLTSVHASAALETGFDGETERVSVSAAAGPEGLQTTLLIWLVAVLVAAALAFATGRADPQHARALVARAGSAVQRNPGRPAQGTPPTGTFPATPPPSAPPRSGSA